MIPCIAQEISTTDANKTSPHDLCLEKEAPVPVSSNRFSNHDHSCHPCTHSHLKARYLIMTLCTLSSISTSLPADLATLGIKLLYYSTVVTVVIPRNVSQNRRIIREFHNRRMTKTLFRKRNIRYQETK